MPKIYTSSVIGSSVDRVWAVIRDFNGLPDWHPLVAESRIEAGAPADQVGCVRSFKLDDGEHLRERLLSHSDADRMYSYNFEKKPFDVDNYHATLRVKPVTDGNVSFVEWYTTFDADRDRVEEWVNFFSQEVFQSALNAVKEHFA